MPFLSVALLMCLLSEENKVDLFAVYCVRELHPEKTSLTQTKFFPCPPYRRSQLVSVKNKFTMLPVISKQPVTCRTLFYSVIGCKSKITGAILEPFFWTPIPPFKNMLFHWAKLIQLDIVLKLSLGF